MTLIKSIYLKCDGDTCHHLIGKDALPIHQQKYSTIVTKDDLRDVAEQKFGWTSDGIYDYCPSCKEV